uniref:Phosphatidylinositol 3,4,5-trisphosphate 5-phosphatase 2A n=1 Tax=Lygus hesperus TaxID=30085 RepID=A0A146M0T3_LYGHE
MGQIHMHLFIRNRLHPLVDIIQVAKAVEATGVANVGTNKGGTCVAIDIMGCSFAFISSHLAAHTEALERRNRDAGNVLTGIILKGNNNLSIIQSFTHIFW